MYTKEHYEANKVKHNARRLVNGRRYRSFIQGKIDEFKRGKPCMDCGGVFPTYVMDFDHLSDKLFNIGGVAGKVSWEKVLQEIEKCELVCANCHRIRTHDRKSKAL